MDRYGTTRMVSLPLYFRWQAAPVLVAASAITGVIYFLGLHALFPFDDLDFWFYGCLYAGVGAVTGAGAWYGARLVTIKRLSLQSLAICLAIPYVFILLLALDKNPTVVLIATLAFGFIFFLAWLGRRSA